MENVGILGIGVYLPPTIRNNDWWSSSSVKAWQKRQQGSGKKLDIDALPPGVQKSVRAMEALRDDPFRGSVQRRVLDQDRLPSEMEIFAAQDALTQVATGSDKIDLLITSSLVPDYLLINPACRVHDALDLPEQCMVLSVNGACDAFQQQLAIASALILLGRAHHALLVQSWCGSRVIDPDEPFSAWFGDGATAVIVGKVPAPYGLLSYVQGCDGAMAEGLVMGVPKKRWYEGRSVLYLADPKITQQMITQGADRARQAIHDALGQAKLGPQDVDFFACHQATKWLRPVVQEYAELDNAKTVDTFASFASLGACNLPLILSIGEKEGLLGKGHVVAMFSAGAGETRSAAVMRWARS